MSTFAQGGHLGDDGRISPVGGSKGSRQSQQFAVVLSTMPHLASALAGTPAEGLSQSCLARNSSRIRDSCTLRLPPSFQNKSRAWNVQPKTEAYGCLRRLKSSKPFRGVFLSLRSSYVQCILRFDLAYGVTESRRSPWRYFAGATPKSR